MGTKRQMHNVPEDTAETIPVPPGFVSLTSLTFKRIKSREAANGTADPPEIIPDPICAPFSNYDINKTKASFPPRPFLRHHQSAEQAQKHTMSASLPKGVIRGCPNCPDCVKVNARCHPEDSRLPEVDDAPVFRPTEEEFKDTLKYITEIRPQAENFGICRIIPPPSWKPPRLLKDQLKRDPSKFKTLVQRIDGLGNFCLERELSSRHEKIRAEGPEETMECIANPGYELGPDLSLRSFQKYADDFKKQFFSKSERVADPETEVLQEPLTARIEGEYWRIIENPSDEIEVLFGADLGSQALKSGFPVRESQSEMSPYSEYVESGWNLNNTPKLPCSLLPYGCHETSKVLVPQLFIGMCFASECWRREDHHLYSLSYMHIGDPKVWYGVPGRYCFKFMAVMRKLFPQLSKHPELLHKLVTQISPSKLRSEGIPVYRCVQNHMEFILIFPGAYHSEFSCGFNCSEAVCFAPLDWLPHGQSAVELYSGYCNRTSISHDMLLLQAAAGAVRAQWEYMVSKKTISGDQLWRNACRKDGILTKAVKARVKLESTTRKYLCSNVTASQMVNEVDSATKMECCICLCDLYLSAVGCSCSPNKYTCLSHAKQLCACTWRDKRFLFRYTIAELNLLVEALEGNNLIAMRNWAKKVQPETVPIMFNNSLENGSGCNADSARGRETTLPSGNGRPVVHGASNEKTEVPPNNDLIILLSDDEDE